MDTSAGAVPRRTPLYDLFRDMGARFVDFAGWEMPVQFSSVIEEHLAVRTAAGLFDVSHMGEIEIEGGDALALVQRVTCNDASRLAIGQAHYTGMLNERGGFVDDILVYRRGEQRYLLVVNAGNTGKDFAWVQARAEGDVRVVDASSRWSLLAIQGPRSEAILQTVCGVDLRSIAYYHFAEMPLKGAASLVSRTGYTGEDGFEIYAPPEAAPGLFRALLEAGGGVGLKPCGLGARDTLRLEAGMPLYGNELDDTTTPLEAGMKWIVKTGKGEFIGRDALLRQEKEGLSRRLAGFEMVDRGIARHGHAVRFEGREVGQVTSGTFGPFIRKNIGTAYVPPGLAKPGARFAVVIRERDAAAIVVPSPFYKRAR